MDVTANTHAWTPIMLTRFAALCADESLTFRAIRDLMNVEFNTDLTRNACIGKARRLAMPPRDPANNPTLKKEPTVAKIFTFPIQPELAPRSKEPFTIDIYQLRRHDCRWPSSDNNRPPFTYCGRHAPDGRYCAIHSKQAHSTPRPRPI